MDEIRLYALIRGNQRLPSPGLCYSIVFSLVSRYFWVDIGYRHGNFGELINCKMISQQYGARHLREEIMYL